MPRFHNSNNPIVRTPFQKVVIWFVEFLITTTIYYFLTRDVRALNYLTLYSINPTIVFYLFPLHFWISLLVILFLAKLFKRTSIIFGSFCIEFFIEYSKSTPLQPVLIGFVVWAVFFESLMPYKGGEYYKGTYIFKQIGIKLGYIILYLPILYYGFIFTYEFTGDLTESIARGYITLNFLVNMLFIIIPLWLSLFLLDRFLAPYFPLTEEESQLIDQSNTIEYKEIDDLIPHPGEFYNHLFTHHSLEEDDHTFVVLIGRVRFYLCTRCSAMILGVIFTVFLTSLFIFELELVISSKVALIMIIILPFFPLTDWGLQALLIRKATTVSRFTTGFILGISMQMLAFTNEYTFWIVIIVSSHFVIFGILFYFRVQIRKKQFDEDAFKEFVDD